MSGALNGSSVRVTRTPPPVTDSVSRRPAWPFAAVGPFAADGPPVRAGSAGCAASTGAPWGQSPAPGREKRPPLPGGRSWMCCTRTSHRLIGGATTDACSSACWEPTGRRARAPPAHHHFHDPEDFSVVFTEKSSGSRLAGSQATRCRSAEGEDGRDGDAELPGAGVDRDRHRGWGAGPARQRERVDRLGGGGGFPRC